MNAPLVVVGTAEHHGHPLVRIDGEVDISNADAVGEQIRAAADLAATVVLDLSPIRFLDSSGLRMLTRLADHVAEAGGSLAVVAPPDGIAGRLLTLTMLDTRLHVLASLPE